MAAYLHQKAIVLSAVKYSESSRVLRCFTENFGVQAYMVNSLHSKKSVLKPGMLLPLTLLEIEATHRGKGTLERIREARTEVIYENIPYDPVRSALALFTSEVLLRCLRDEEPDEKKFSFIRNACLLLDSQGVKLTNFPAFFLIKLSRFLGFYPEAGNVQPGYFDLIEGVFHKEKPFHAHFMNEACSRAFWDIIKAEDMSSIPVLAKPVRKDLLQDLLNYYSFHVSDFGRLRSVEVLEEVLKG